MNRSDHPQTTRDRQDRHAPHPIPYLNAEYHRISKAPFVGFGTVQNDRFSYVNRPAARILGYETPEQLTGAPFLELIHPEDRCRANSLIGSAATLPEGINFCCKVNRADGETIQANLRITGSTYRGAPAYWVCLTDLSAIEAVKRYRDKYEAILNEVEDAVAEVDLNGNLTFYTEAACRMWKVSRSEWIGKNYRAFMDASWAEVARKAYRKVYETGLPGENIIYQIIRNDGRRIFVEDTISAIHDSSGAVTGFRAVSRDITGRRAAERQMADQRVHLEALFRSIKDAVITVDMEMRVLEVNAAAEKICGIDPQNVQGRPLVESFGPCNRACCEVLRQTVELQKSIMAFRIDCELRQRHPQMVSVNCTLLKDADGSIMGAVMVNRDITKLRDLEKQLGQRRHYQGIIGKSKRMQEIYRLIEDLAELDTTVLITGESGTGKEMVARALHQSGSRAFKPFVAVHCSALAEGLLESELFGHAKGAFTGAVENKRGRFETAQGGTILLDEIGDISPISQLKLLRVLQEKEFERVGETTSRKADVRIIACTNSNLKQKVCSGEFRQDLFYRLKVVEIQMPPLRERTDDIPLLVDHFCQHYNNKFNKEIQGVSDEVMARLIAYPWPGNVRELKHAMESAFVLCEKDRITRGHLPAEIRNFTSPAFCSDQEENATVQDEKREIMQVLRLCLYNKSRAAKKLGYSRQTLYKKIKALGIYTDAGL